MEEIYKAIDPAYQCSVVQAEKSDISWSWWKPFLFILPMLLDGNI